jgi:hypothetical protein
LDSLIGDDNLIFRISGEGIPTFWYRNPKEILPFFREVSSPESVFIQLNVFRHFLCSLCTAREDSVRENNCPEILTEEVYFGVPAPGKIRFCNSVLNIKSKAIFKGK